MEGSVLNVALPAIRESYGAGAQEVQWVVNAYLLPLSALHYMLIILYLKKIIGQKFHIYIMAILTRILQLKNY